MNCLLVASLALVPWRPGWGFYKHGGYPPNPWASWQLNRSTAAYFVGNASGMDSPTELKKETHLGYVGIGWQLNNIPSHHSHLETYEIQEAQRLKALRSDVRVSVLRNTEVATTFWDSAFAKMYDPRTQDYWTQCDGKPCVGQWSSPAGNTDKFWFNFSNPALRKWWVYEYIGQAANETLFDGVYFDCCCGSPKGVAAADAAQFQADAQLAFDEALDLLRAKGKWASAWNSDGSSDDLKQHCSATMARWIEQGADPAHALQPLATLFLKGRGTLADQNNTVAAFLLARGPSAMLELPVMGAYESMDGYDMPPILSADFGEPLAQATRAGNAFSRKFSRGTISLDCDSWSSSFTQVEHAEPPISGTKVAWPPTNASWTRMPHNPVVVADAPWEGITEGHPCVCEPQAFWVAAEQRWRIYYRGGWGTGAIGLAFSDDGHAWTKHGGNPVFGGGGSAEAGSMMQPWVAVEGGTWWLWTSTWDTTRASSSTNIATSTDGIAWTTRNASVPLPEGGSATLFGNRAAWSEGGGWVMLQEVGIPSPWSIYLYRSHDGLAWTLENGGRPVSGLQRHEGGMYGGPSLANVEGVAQPRDADGRYHMWYHAASAAGNLPTNVYHATSTNLTAWAASPAGPVLAHGGAKFEYDQVADPSVALHAGKSFLYYDGDNNRVGSAAIGGAVGATARSRAT